MSLIAMATYCTEQNGRTEYLETALQSIKDSVDLTIHDFYLVDNASCLEAVHIYQRFADDMPMTIICNTQNIGTAKAINSAWRNRKENQHCIKIDDDIVVHEKMWVEQLEEVVERDDSYGQVSLKRNDLWENTEHENPFYRTTLKQLPHENGQRWIIVEETNHCIGSCVLHSSKLINKIGGLYQPSTYGLDDSLMSLRSHAAGFKNCFLSHIPIVHLEASPSPEWQKEKDEIVKKSWNEYNKLKQGYKDKTISYYYPL